VGHGESVRENVTCLRACPVSTRGQRRVWFVCFKRCHACGSLWISATARSGVLSSRSSSADDVQMHLKPLPPVAPAGAWSAGGIESISPQQNTNNSTNSYTGKNTHEGDCIEGWDGGRTSCTQRAPQVLKQCEQAWMRVMQRGGQDSGEKQRS
jgi:hypothetical protein